MTVTPEMLEAALSRLDEVLAAIGGCTDGYCVVVRPKGMHTNGGCRCWSDRMKMQRFAYAYNEFRAALSSQSQAQEQGK